MLNETESSQKEVKRSVPTDKQEIDAIVKTFAELSLQLKNNMTLTKQQLKDILRIVQASEYPIGMTSLSYMQLIDAIKAEIRS